MRTRLIFAALIALSCVAPASAAVPFTDQQCNDLSRLRNQASQADVLLGKALAYVNGLTRGVPSAYFKQAGVQPNSLMNLNSQRPRIGQIQAISLAYAACGSKSMTLSESNCKVVAASGQQAAAALNSLTPTLDRFSTVSTMWGNADPQRTQGWQNGLNYARSSISNMVMAVNQAAQISSMACSNVSMQNGGGNDGGSRARVSSPFNR